MAVYTPKICAQNSRVDLIAEFGPLIPEQTIFGFGNISKNFGSLNLAATNECGDPNPGDPATTIRALETRYQDDGGAGETVYDSGTGGNCSGPFLCGYIQGGAQKYYGSVEPYQGVAYSQAYMFLYDGGFSYEIIASDFPAFQFDFGYFNACPMGDYNNPAIGIIQSDSANNKRVLQQFALGNPNSVTINMLEYDADNIVYEAAAGFIQSGGVNYFGYIGAFDNGVDYFERFWIAVTQPSDWADPIVSENLVIEFADSPIDIGFWGGQLVGQSDTQFYYVSVNWDIMQVVLFAVDFDGNSYDCYVIHDWEFYGIVGMDSTGQLIGESFEFNTGENFIAVFSPFGPTGTNETKILTPISLPCTNPCIPLLRMN